MPNQNNFRSDITNKTESRFLASRIVEFPEDGILVEQLAGSFGYNVNDVVELHFYTYPGNTLLFSTTVELNIPDVLKIHTVAYADGTFKNYLRIDFTKLFEEKNLTLVPSEYRLVINLFSNEIGAYSDRNLVLEEISNSRTEVQLRFRNPATFAELEKNKKDTNEFILPSFPKNVATLVANQILTRGITNNDASQGLTYETVAVDETALVRVQRVGSVGEEELRQKINDFLLNVYENVREQIIMLGDARIQQNEFFDFINAAVEQEILEMSNASSRILII
jgi:hypothetical protein